VSFPGRNESIPAELVANEERRCAPELMLLSSLLLMPGGPCGRK
jgi:hypothetical protein